MLNEICKDVEIEPRPQPITGEQMRYRTATSGDAARLDTKARSFWRSNQAAFFDINVTHVIQKPKPRADIKKSRE